jgi:hypothetical protein
VAKCPKCNRRINSTYIREGQKALWKKIGYFCPVCNTHYDMKLKLYAKAEKVLLNPIGKGYPNAT